MNKNKALSLLVESKKLKILFSVFFILAITFISFLPSLKNDFVNWDDPQYALENTSIRKLTPGNIKTIFSSFYVGNYQPLTMLTYSVEYNFFKLNPVAYHATNMFLHLMNCLLVFWLIFLLGKNIFVAFFTSLFFGIHPMHVESVAWVSQRKDVLYALFFLMALISYLYYLKDRSKRKFYYLCLALFLLSCLSKSMAVSLPFVLLLFDYFSGRRLEKKAFAEKLPFLALTAIFVVIALFSQQAEGAIRHKYLFSLPQRLIIFSSALAFYFMKILTPIKLSAIYPYPNVSVAELPGHFLLSPLLILVFVALVLYSRRYGRKVTFGSLFFLFTTLPVLQLIPVGNALAADRYTYISSIGLFYLMGEFYLWIYSKRLKNSVSLRTALIVFLVGLTAVTGFLAWRRAKVWKNSLILFEDVLKQYPGSYLGYNNRGTAYLDAKEYDKAIRDFNAAITIDPNNAYAYVNLCNANNFMGSSQAAIMLCKKAIKLDPANVKAYFNLANAYADLGENEEAIITYRKTIKLDKGYADAYHNLATVYITEGNHKLAIDLLKKAIEIDPDLAQAYYSLAITYAYEKQFDSAIAYCDKAVSLGYKPEGDFLETLKPYRQALTNK